MKLVVISADLSPLSPIRVLADRLADTTRWQLTAHGHEVDTRVVELRDLAADIAHVMETGSPGSDLRHAVKTVAQADGVIAVSPIFSASSSGLFKSFFDVLDNTTLTGKPVLLAATGATARHSVTPERALRPLFSRLRATLVPTTVYAATEDWGAACLADRIVRAGRELGSLMGGRAAITENTESVVPLEQ